MGLVYLPKWMVDFDGFHVGKYTFVPWILWGADSGGVEKKWHLRRSTNEFMMVSKLGENLLSKQGVRFDFLCLF